MVKEYLQRYNYDERRFIVWIKSQGFNPHDAVAAVVGYSKAGRDFRSGDELCHQITVDLHDLDMNRFFTQAHEVIEEVEEEQLRVKDERSKLRKIWDLIVGR